MSTWKQAMRAAEEKAFATRKRWMVLGHRDAYVGWCYHAYYRSMWAYRDVPPRERR